MIELSKCLCCWSASSMCRMIQVYVITEMCKVTCMSPEVSASVINTSACKGFQAAADNVMAMPWIWWNINSSCWNKISNQMSLRLYVHIGMAIFQIWHFGKLLQVFSWESPLASWNQAVQCSYNAVQLVNYLKNVSGCYILTQISD